jgi:hypothetical protein
MQRFLAIIGVLVCLACSRGPREDRRGTARIQDEDKLATHALSSDERRVVDTTGFAILGGGPVKSFHLGYGALFRAHQPVYVTADALLHAWHASPIRGPSRR